MDWLTIGLSVVVIVFLILASRKSLSIIIPSMKATDITKHEGVIKKVLDEKSKAVDGGMVKLKMPIYECAVNEKIHQIHSLNYFRNISVGDEVTICYSEEKGVLWAEQDIPYLKKKIAIQCLVSMSLVILMIVETILL